MAGLERIAEAFRVLIWDHAKATGLSPMQIQILIFIAYHADNLCNVSHLAREFNVTKPTISDAIKALDQKELIIKETSALDKRAYSIYLTGKGKTLLSQTEHFAQPIYEITRQLKTRDQEELFGHLYKIIHLLNRHDVLTVQRMCFNCRFYENKAHSHYCHLLCTTLKEKDIRIDCPEFESK